MGDPPYEERRKCLIAKSYLNIISHTDNHPTKQSLNRKATYLYHKKNIKENKKPYFKVATDMLINNEKMKPMYILSNSSPPRLGIY